MSDAMNRDTGGLEVTQEEILNPKTGIYIDEKRWQYVALGFSAEGIRELGRCSASISPESIKSWKRDVWKRRERKPGP